MLENDDIDLIAQIAQGDRSAIGALYQKHHVKVFRFVRRFVKQVETAEDVTNDVFMEVWRNANRYEGRSRALTWILGIARFKALTAARKSVRTPTDGSDDIAEVVDPADSPEEVAQKVDKASALRTCIDRLSQDHRTMIDLVYYHERSISEIATILDIPIGTVKTRTYHARKRLSAEMADLGIDRGWP